MATEITAETAADQKEKDARNEKIAFAILGLIVVAFALGFLTLGVPGLGIVAVSLVPIIYVLLVVMAGGKG